MTSLRTYVDTGSLLVIVLTFVLFVLAPFWKGFTHDLLLEALATDRLKERLDEIQSALRR